MFPMATKRWTRTLTACLMALALVMVTPAAAAQEDGPPEEAIEFFPCGAGAARAAITQVNDTAPLDLGKCEEYDGTWYFVPGNDTQDVFDQVPDPGGPPGVPTPQDLPPQLNRCQHEDWENWTDQMIGDANCNGWSNVEELEEGCDPLDPTTNPNTPDQCNLIPPEEPDQLEPWATGWLPRALNCAGEEAVLDVVDQLIGNADCNDHSNIEELKGRCNPLNPISYPGSPFPGACFPEPNPDDPEESANQTVLWALMQAGSAQGAVLGALPSWLAGIIGWLLNHPGIPEPPE